MTSSMPIFFPQASRQRQDSLLQTVDDQDQKEAHRRRASSSARAYLDQLVQSTRDKHAYQPFLPPPRRESTQQLDATGRRRTLPSLRDETRVPVCVPPTVTSIPSLQEQNKTPGPDLHMARHMIRYTRCCNRTWLVAIEFTSSLASIPAPRDPSIVSHNPLNNTFVRTNSEDICYRCLDRVRWRAWRLRMNMGLRERLFVMPLPKWAKVKWAYEWALEQQERKGRREGAVFVIGSESTSEHETGTESDDQGSSPEEESSSEHDEEAWSSGDETVVAEDYDGFGMELVEREREEDVAAVEAAGVLFGMAYMY